MLSPPFFPAFLLKFLRTSEKEAAESSAPAVPGRSASAGAVYWLREVRRAVYWLREVRRAEDGVEIEVKWDVWYNGG